MLASAWSSELRSRNFGPLVEAERLRSMIDSEHEIRVRSRFGPLKVRITIEAIKALRDAGSKSIPSFVIAEQRHRIEAVAIQKYAEGDVSEDGFVLLDRQDFP